MPYYIHHSNDIEIYLNTRSNAVGCCECHFYCFFHYEHVSVLLRKELARSPSMRRVTSTNVLLHPCLRDTRSSGFRPYAATQFVLTSLTSYWTTSVIASVRYDTPVVIHHWNIPR
ncbi:uncharacterized protein LOC124208725 [Daphnia pulex]|uniref:uncharacterized protein LOC124208725 n=1 Tax=Daphnia pulex TaxID=6669 RepID=UPI001EDEB6B9|nr:uncharacterized protein LOC124208725 [Daphnia pulex]